jgi:hypothetical protein
MERLGNLRGGNKAAVKLGTDAYCLLVPVPLPQLFLQFLQHVQNADIATQWLHHLFEDLLKKCANNVTEILVVHDVQRHRHHSHQQYTGGGGWRKCGDLYSLTPASLVYVI